ncbi:MAG: AfsR/SARP family transcriptional regulator, partial [Acidimicrobiales bacterium]
MDSGELDFRVLGPLAVVRDGSEVALGGPRQRLVLALLLLNAGRVVAAERLVDLIWGESEPATRTGPLRTYVWQLRRVLDADPDPDGEAPGPVVSRGAGYLLDIDRSQVDSVRFETQFAAARADMASGKPQRALLRLDEALGLWRGSAFADLALAPPVANEATRLDELFLGAKELRADLLLATGQPGPVAA